MSKLLKKTTRLEKKTKKGVIAQAQRQVTISVLGHGCSQAVRVMEMLRVKRIVRIWLRTDTDNNPRAATAEQMDELESYIHAHVLCRMPFPNGTGQIIYCRHDASFTDECILSSYQAVLDAVFGKGHYHARIYRIGGEA